MRGSRSRRTWVTADPTQAQWDSYVPTSTNAPTDTAATPASETQLSDSANASGWLNHAETLAANFARAAEAAQASNAATLEQTYAPVLNQEVGTLSQLMTWRNAAPTTALLPHRSQVQGQEAEDQNRAPVRAPALPQLPVFPFAASSVEQQHTQGGSGATGLSVQPSPTGSDALMTMFSQRPMFGRQLAVTTAGVAESNVIPPLVGRR